MNTIAKIALPTAQKFLFDFNEIKLQTDLQNIKENNWIRHYRESNYIGNWGIVALRAAHGHPACIHAVPSTGSDGVYQNTPLLAECTYFQEVIEAFKCPVNSVRLMRLAAGAKILEHSDDMGEGAYAEVRIHIPIQTNEAVDFFINQQRIDMQVGEVWFGDFNLPHRVDNNGTEDRIHLVLDCILNDWLRKNILSSPKPLENQK